LKKTFSLVLLFVFALVIFVLWQLPTYVAAQFAAKWIPSQVQLGSLSGTIWQGQVSEVRYQQLSLKNVRWDITPAALLRGHLDFDLKVGNPRDKDEIAGLGNVTLDLLSGAMMLEKSTLWFSVDQALGHVTLPLPVDAKGRVTLTIDQFQTGTPYCTELNGQIRSANIDVKGLNSWFSIGELEGQLNCKSGDIAVSVLPDNKLGLQADATLSNNLQFSVNGKVKPDASLPKEVHDAVKFLGRADSDGFYPVKL
jgi:general secretion pathway protein N